MQAVSRFGDSSIESVAPIDLDVGPSSRKSFDEVRELFCKGDAVKNASGSCYYEHGTCKIVCAVYGPKQQFDAGRGFIRCDLKYAPYSCKKERRSYRKDDEEKQLSVLLESTIESVVLLDRIHGSFVDVFITVLEANANVVADCLNAATVALSLAQVEMRDLLVACSVGVTLDRSFILDVDRDELIAAKLILAYSLGRNRVAQLLLEVKDTFSLDATTFEEMLRLAIDGCMATDIASAIVPK